MSDVVCKTCLWCGQQFTPRQSGGTAQRFCSATCRHALDTAARRWVMRAIEAGLLTAGTLDPSRTSARAVLGPFQQEPAPADPARADQGEP